MALFMRAWTTSTSSIQRERFGVRRRIHPLRLMRSASMAVRSNAGEPPLKGIS